ncbi:MAG: hypothetical protein HC906_00145 [Bacteroidales bacterium]|nr:hypothetical protein [Bacteroidales bacterium]
MLDIKLPIGLMFLILGIILTLFGIFTMSNPDMYKASFQININLWSGILMLVFGGAMVLFSRRSKKVK